MKKINDKVNVVLEGDLIGATIIDIKKTIFGNYKYRCVYTRKFISHQVRWFDGKDVYSVGNNK